MSKESLNNTEQAKKRDVDTHMLLSLQRETFKYFVEEINEKNGLVIDKTQPGSPSSIAVVGLALSSYIAGVERGLLTREDAIKKTRTILRFFYNAPQSTSKDATGYKGFFYHFLDMKTGKRIWKSELSTIDTALFIAGALTAGSYFANDSDDEKEIRELADKLYKRVDWQWALNCGTTICHGWKPEGGFLKDHWGTGYSEALILYILALGSPTFPIDANLYKEWQSTFEWKRLYDIDHLYAGPLFIHQLSHIWIDFRGITDDFNKKTGIDYFENSRRATCIQQKYAIHNPLGYERYGAYCWGLSASDGPGNVTRIVKGRKIKFYNYTARGVDCDDDGTISPWGVVASLPFAPDIVLDTVRHIIETLKLVKTGDHGLHASFNATFPEKNTDNGWVSPWQFGLNQGPVVLMIENYMSGLIWKQMQTCPYIITGLKRAGFSGGWLEHKPHPVPGSTTSVEQQE
jgi:hypothetical protein